MNSVKKALLSLAVAAALVVLATAALGEPLEFDSDAHGGRPLEFNGSPARGGNHVARASTRRSHGPARSIVISVRAESLGQPIASGFVGLSLEFPAVRSYTGARRHAINPVLEQLIRNLAPGQSPVLRIGGNSTDSTWWPAAAMSRPRGVSYTLGRGWLATTRSLAQNLHARLIVGVNLKVDRPSLAIAATRALLDGLGPRNVQAIEIGNEPDNYPQLPLYRVGDRQVYARTGNYSFQRFTREFSRLRARLPSIPLAGPAVGRYKWLSHIRSFLAAEPGLALVTFHRYPLNRCFVGPRSPWYPTIRNLLSPAASRGFVARIKPYAALAHAHGLRFRVDEMNSVACGGKRGVSDTFASALWVLDALFQIARVGVDGVNIHTFPSAAYTPFTFRHTDGHWWGSVRPEYYGLLMFARAAPPGARLLKLTSPTVRGLQTWATLGPDGKVRVVLINKSLSHRRVVTVRLRGAGAVGTLERLTARSAHAKRGVTIAGQSIANRSGLLVGPEHDAAVHPASAGYVVTLRPASAALLSVPRAR